VTHPVNQAIRLTDGTFYGADPHPHLRWMRENAPVYWDAAAIDAASVYAISSFFAMYIRPRSTVIPAIPTMASKPSAVAIKANPRSPERRC